MITADQLKDVVDRVSALHHYLNIDRKQVEFEEEQLRTQAPDFWDDPKRAEAQMKKVKGIEKWLKGYQEVKNFADVLRENAWEHQAEVCCKRKVFSRTNRTVFHEGFVDGVKSYV